MNGRILETVNSIKIINGHEHLPDECDRLRMYHPWSETFKQYNEAMLMNAGMTPAENTEFFADETSHDRRWEIFAKFYPLCKNTSYMKAAVLGIEKVYGINEISYDSMALLEKQMNSNTEGFYRRELCEKGNIDYCVVVCIDDFEKGNKSFLRTYGDLSLLRQSIKMDDMLTGAAKKTFIKQYGIEIKNFGEYLEAVDRFMEDNRKFLTAFKYSSSYKGHLNFNPLYTEQDAKQIYEDLGKNEYSYEQRRPLVDFMFYYTLEYARKYNLPVQFHTGIRSGFDRASFADTAGNIKHLAEIAVRYPDIKFVPLHTNWPWQGDVLYAAKQITNIYADMSWVWVVDTNSAKNFLKSAVSAVPINKIIGFGGDYKILEPTLGHIEIAKQNIALALSEMVDEGNLGLDDALFAAKYILRDSAEGVFGK